jgi:hypothetical protein
MAHVMAPLPTCTNRVTTGRLAQHFTVTVLKTNASFKWLAVLLRIWEVLGLNLGLKTSYPQHQQANAGIEHQIGLDCFLHVICSSSFTHQPIKEHYMVRATEHVFK